MDKWIFLVRCGGRSEDLIQGKLCLWSILKDWVCHCRFILNVGISFKSDIIYWFFQITMWPVSHSYIYNWRPELWGQIWVVVNIGNDSKRELMCCNESTSSHSTNKKVVSCTKLSLLTPTSLGCSLLSREVPILIHSPEVHHTLWMSLGLLRSTIFI